MNKYIYYIIVLLAYALNAAASTATRQLEQFINTGLYQQAAQDILSVDSWTDEMHLDVDSVVAFVSYIKDNNLSIAPSLIDSLSICAYKSLEDQAWVNADTCNYAQSIPLYKKLLQYNQLLIADKTEQTILLRNIAYCYYREDSLQLAERYFVDALNMTKELSSDESIENYEYVLNWLINHYEEHGEYNLAKEHLLSLLQFQKKQYGTQHTSYIDSQTKLAKLYHTLGDYKTAEKIYLAVLEYRTKNKQEFYYQYITLLENLGTLYYDKAELTLADQYYTQAIGGINKDDDQYATLYASLKNSLANIYADLGDYDLAIKYINSALQHLKKHHQDESTDYALTLSDLGTIYINIAEYRDAEKCYTNALTIIKKIKKEQTAAHAQILDNYGSLMQMMSDYDAAETYYNQALSIREKLFGTQHIDYLITYRGLAVLESNNKPEIAEKKLQVILKTLKKTVGDKHFEYAATLVELGYVYLHLEKYSLCKNHFLQAKEILSTTLGEQNQHYGSVLNALGLLYYATQDYPNAENYYKQALEIFQNGFGKHHLDCAYVLDRLAGVYLADNAYIGLSLSLAELRAKAVDCLSRSLAIKKQVFGEDHQDYIFTLYELANVYSVLGDYSLAETYLKDVVAFDHKHQTRNYVHSLQDLAYVYLVQENYSLAERYYLAAHKACTQKEDLPSTLSNVGDFYHAQGDYKSAEKYYLEGLQVAQTLGDDMISTFILSSMGLIHIAQKDYKKAEDYYLQALKVAPDSHLKIDIYIGLGNSYSLMHNYTAAEKYFLLALEGQRNYFGATHPHYINGLIAAAKFYEVKGDFNQAITYLEQAREGAKNLGEAGLPFCGIILSELGALYAGLEQNEQLAEQYLLEAVSVFEMTQFMDSLRYATALSNLADFYSNRGAYDQAEKYIIQAYINSPIEENSTTAVNILFQIGQIHLMNGRFVEAKEAFEKVVEKSKDLLFSHTYHNALSVLAFFYASEGQLDKAKECCQTAIAACENTYGKKHIITATTYKTSSFLSILLGDYKTAKKHINSALKIWDQPAYKHHSGYGEALYKLAEIEYVCKNYKSSEKYLRLTSDVYKNRFIATTDYMTESQRAAYWQLIQPLYERDLPIFTFETYNQNPKIVEFAYNSELFRKGILLSSSNDIRYSILNSGDSLLIQQWNELTSVKQAILKMEEKNQIDESYEKHQQLADSLEKSLTISSSAYRANKARWNVTWDSVRHHLSKNEVAIEFIRIPYRNDYFYGALVIKHNSPKPMFIPICTEDDILSLVTNYDASAKNPNQIYLYDENGRELKNLIWGRLLNYGVIQRGDVVYFAPTDQLHQIAIEYLPYDEQRTMADVFRMVRLSSTREIVLPYTTNNYSHAAVYGGIKYDTDVENMMAESYAYEHTTYNAKRSLVPDSTYRGGVENLPGTKKEAEHIHSLLKANNISVQLYAHTKANEESFKALSGHHNNILHIGTHGFTWTDTEAREHNLFAQRLLSELTSTNTVPYIDPLARCGLLFAGANTALSGNSNFLPDGVEDGILTAKEISLMDLRDADLVVLSACETAKGDITSEGVFGLQRAFKMAGVQTIIMSLWKVSDQATQLLMTEFYTNWIGKKQSKREAFQEAQNTVRNKYNDPVYWAGFIMLN